MPDVLVSTDGVSRRFGAGDSSIVALHATSCVIERGARIALVGPSGSGKSTLLHVLAGLDQPTVGTISWPGLPQSRSAPGGISVVFQGPSLLPSLTIFENVAFPLLLQGLPEPQALAIAAEALTRFDIASLSDKLPEEISGGQAQRAGICRATAARPALLIADEPTGQLDSASATLVLETLLDALAQTDAAAIIATHDRRVVERLPVIWHIQHGVLEMPAECRT